MLSTFAEFNNRLIRTSNSSQRPSSISYTNPSIRQTNSSYISIRGTKQSATITSQSSKIRFTHRQRSKSEFKSRAKTISSLDQLPKVNQDYRLQIINPHCLRKVALREPEVVLSVLEGKGPVFGQGLSRKKAERKDFLGKKLKCLKIIDSRRLNTEPDYLNPQKFEISGLRIL